jgi:riboflavin synthase
MFTGIIEELGTVRAVERRAGGARLEITCEEVLDDAVVGASIAVNGCCLTVVELGADDEGARWWAAEAQPETLDRTTLGGLAVGDPVNLERPLRLADRLGGHLVQGHVDGVATVVGRRPEADGSTRVDLEIPRDLARYVVEKGSVALDGVSLTITEIQDPQIQDPDVVDNGAGTRVGVALIPHTLAVTTFGTRESGQPVNVEVDLMAKYVERLAGRDPQEAK